MIALLALTTVWGASPEDRALAYLAREVPRWSAEFKCYSCHNNGDGARALYLAVRLGKSVPPRALADTSRFLTRPDDWEKNPDGNAFSEQKQARLQFSATLAAAVEAGQVKDRGPVDRATALLAERQRRDGSWMALEDGTLGGPTTHGNTLATTLARSTLLRLDARKYEQAVTRADAWLRGKEVKSVLDASSVLLALGKADDAAAEAQRRQCLDLLQKGEAKGGGWGPYVNSPPEVFDTALAVLALSGQEQTEEVKARIKRGRAYLIAAQEPDGFWQATTRPSGGESYAQQLSTTGWATMALLATAP
jgi:hypothetical protein